MGGVGSGPRKGKQIVEYEKCGIRVRDNPNVKSKERLLKDIQRLREVNGDERG